ncbi:hypothetical protein ACQE98_08785 [Ornithinimicrobium sp. W1679]|uniref:hypothetical protein n=1 Tax=Ornithinimicrobium sp. W1679 TaxID=3418770 RepID=UPI003CEE080B
MRRILTVAVTATALTLTAAGTATAYDLDAGGYGFVGKGEVQSVLGWNNKGLQTNAGAVGFTQIDRTVTEQAWECSNARSGKVQYRKLTTTTRTTALLDSAARMRNQVTGFSLDGFGPVTTDVSYVTEGYGDGQGGDGGCGGGDHDEGGGHDDGSRDDGSHDVGVTADGHDDGAGHVPEVNKCPGGTPWSLTRAAGDPVVLESTSGLYVTVGDDMRLLPDWVSLRTVPSEAFSS